MSYDLPHPDTMKAIAASMFEDSSAREIAAIIDSVKRSKGSVHYQFEVLLKLIAHASQRGFVLKPRETSDG